MSKLRTLFVGISLLSIGTTLARAQNLLTNGDLEAPPNTLENPDLAPTGWTLTEDPPPPTNSAMLIGFAAQSGAQGLWLREFEGLFFGSHNERIDAILTQSVPASADVDYTFTGWSRWETNYSGGVTTLAAGSPSGGGPSPTRTEMQLTFLDLNNLPLASSLLDLRTQQSNDGVWRLHTLKGIAPAGTTHLTVTAAAYDMIPNVDPGQSAFFDNFALVPEPSSFAMILAGAVCLIRSARRR